MGYLDFFGIYWIFGGGAFWAMKESQRAYAKKSTRKIMKTLFWILFVITLGWTSIGTAVFFLANKEPLVSSLVVAGVISLGTAATFRIVFTFDD